MKKFLPHIILAIVLGVAIFMVLTAKTDSRRVLNRRLSFKRQDKIPYGAWVAHKNLRHIFPQAAISVNRKEPGYWDSLSSYDSKQALIIISPWFLADDEEMKRLISFAQNGNDVFISSRYVSDAAEKVLKVNTAYVDYSEFFYSQYYDDTLTVSLQPDSTQGKTIYNYPGRKFQCTFYDLDKSRMYELGYNEGDEVNFVRLRTGKGNIYLHLAPVTFTNYFLLHKNNMSYYETALSHISKDIKQVVWDEYFIYKDLYSDHPRVNNKDKKGLLSVLFQYPGLKWAFWSALLLLLLYVLLEMRRKQRFIPVIKKPANDSLDFVKTIGRLYFDRGDHKNLCRKMSSYFLEHIRNRYKLATGKMDDSFIKNLQYKTGYPEPELNSIIVFIRNLENTIIGDKQLEWFYLRLEDFYKKT
jgi:hypothetical protein